MKRILAVILATLAGTGCASITRGTTEIFVIETTPSNSRATLSTGLTCKTPCSLTVPRRGDFVVTIERDGYETVRSNISSGVDGDGAAGMAGNVIFGGILGAGIDAGSGAMQSHKPNPLQVTLVPLDTTPEDIATLQSDDRQPAGSIAEEGVHEAAEDLAGGESSE